MHRSKLEQVPLGEVFIRRLSEFTPFPLLSPSRVFRTQQIARNEYSFRNYNRRLFSSASDWANNLFQASQVPFQRILSAWCYLDGGRPWVTDTGPSIRPEITKCLRTGAVSQDVGQVWGAARSQDHPVNGLVKERSQHPRQARGAVDAWRLRLSREAVCWQQGGTDADGRGVSGCQRSE